MNPSRHAAALLAALLFLPALAAQSLTGRVVSPTGQPIAGIDVDAGGGTTAATTDAAGFFTIAGLQNDDYDIEYLPPFVAPWAARMITTVVNGATNVGDVVLQPGFAVSGVVRNEAGVALFSCNVNVYDADGTKLFTPHDGSDLNGNWSVTVPAGPHEVRILPPVGAPLVPFVAENVAVNGATSLGVVTLHTGHAVTGTVVDAASSVPVGQTRIRAFDALTGTRIVLVNDTVTTFGQFTLLLPFGTADLEFLPPVGNTHVGRKLYGVVVPGPTALGNVGLTNGVLVSGTVTGPAGVVAGADIDVLDADGTKTFTAHDATDGTGLFRVAVPTGSGWHVRVEPPVSLGLVGYRSPALTLSGPTSLGTIALVAGVTVDGFVRGRFGRELGAHLVFDNGVTEVVTVGDRTDASGRFRTFVPSGSYLVTVESAEGSASKNMTTRMKVAPGVRASFSLPAKEVRCTLDSLGIPTLPQGGLILLEVVVQSLTGATRPTTMEFVVESPAGAIYPMVPPLPLGAPPTAVSLGANWLPLPTLPAGLVGKMLRVVVRFRDPATQVLLDEASTEFVLR